MNRFARHIATTAPKWGWLLLLLALFSTDAFPAERTFSLGGANIILEDVSGDLEAHFRSLRFNRAQNVWNAEVILTNRSSRVVQGPFLLSLDSISGSAGPKRPDGFDNGQPARPFFDFSGNIPTGRLAPGENSSEKTISLLPGAGAPQLKTKVFAAVNASTSGFALGVVRSLNEVGQPLAGVQIEEISQLGKTNFLTDPVFGVATLGQIPGAHAWKFTAPGRLPVWRVQNLLTGVVADVPSVRLVARHPVTATLNATAGARLTNGSVQISFSAAAGAPRTVALLSLSGQTLPALLPSGWSPLQVFSIEVDPEPIALLSGSLDPVAPISPAETVALVRWDEQTLQWQVKQLLAGKGSNAVSLLLPGSGSYALVAPDVGPTAPPPAQVGQVLPASTFVVGTLASLSANGVVDPQSTSASRTPQLVTATAAVTINNGAGPLPSGTILRTEVAESYRLRDGTTRHPPLYDNVIVGYQRPGEFHNGQLQAKFPLRPIFLFGSEALDEAVVKVDILTPLPFSGAIFDSRGGQVNVDDLRLVAGSGDVAGRQAALLRRIELANFNELLPTNTTVAAAFELSVSGIASGHHLVVQLGGLPANQSFVLARVLYDAGVYGLQPVERFASDDSGQLGTREPSSGDRLDGITGAGQYVLVSVPQPQALIVGTARNSAAQPAAGLPVRVQGQPWLALSGVGGAFKLIAPEGDTTLSSIDSATGDSGEAALLLSNTQPAARADIALGAVGPRVVSTSPTNNAPNVTKITPIGIAFSKPINPGSLAANGIQLLGTNDQPVNASLTLNLRNTVATLLPLNPLPSGTKHAIQLSAAITDTKGLPLVGETRFTFTTQPDITRADAARLTIFEPGAQQLTIGGLDVRPLLVGFSDIADPKNTVVAYGSPGTAEAEVPVILVNETSGETATVLSKPDGSFAGFVTAAAEDFVTAVFLNQNNTNIRIPATRQQFDDGRIGLYKSGGILEAQSDGGPLQLIVKPNAIDERTVFKLEMKTLADLLVAAKGVLPQNARPLVAFQFQAQGSVKEEGIDISMPFDAVALQLPADLNPEDASLGLLVPQEVDGVTAYQMVDKLRYKDGKIFSNTTPFPGIAGMIIQELLNKMTTITLFGGKPVVASGYVVEAKRPVAELAQNLPTTPELINEMLTGGFIGNFPFVGDQAERILTDPSSLFFKPLAGALVFSAPIGGGRPAGVAGRVEAGAVYATADQRGLYALALPVRVAEAAVPFTSVTGYSLVAVHPRFNQKLVGGLSFSEIGVDVGQAPFFRRNVIFSGALASGGSLPALKVEAAIQPPNPALEQPAHIRAVAYSANGQASMRVLKDAVVSTVEGQTVQDGDVSIENVQSTYLGNGVTEMTATATAHKSAQALLSVRATQTLNGGTLADGAVLFVRFGQAEPPVTDSQKPSDPANRVGPSVLQANIADGGTLPPSGRIVLQLSQPVTKLSVQRAGAIVLTPAALAPPSISLSADQQTLEIFPGLFPDTATDIKLNLTSAIIDLAGNHFDQVPGEFGDQPYNLSFKPPVTRQLALSGIQNGGGIVSFGGFIYALERGPTPGIAIYRVDDVLGGNSARAGFVSLIGEPRDLVLIEDWPHKRSLHDPFVRTNTLLAVVGGDAGTKTVDSDKNITFAGQFLRVFDLSTPTSPERVVGALLTVRNTVVNRVVWSPPYLGYIESGSDLQVSTLLNLQAMMVGFNGTEAETGGFTEQRFDGTDLDQNGSFVQANERLPTPERNPLEFFGKEATFTLDEPGLIQDLALDRGFAAEVTTGGIDPLHPARPPTAPAYRTLKVNGNPLPEELGVLGFDAKSRPKRLFVLLDRPMRVNGTEQRRSLALVTMAPDADGKGKIVLVDLANPAGPQVSQEGDAIEVPAVFGLPQSITRRDDGLLALATTTHLLLLDPVRLLALAPGGPGTAGNGTFMHPAVVAVIPQAGSGNRTLQSEPTGVNLVNLGTRNLLVQSAPRLSFVIFPTSGSLIDPRNLVGNDAQLVPAFAAMRPLTGIPLARLKANGGAASSIESRSPVAHSYVLVECPGAAGTEITVALEALNAAGSPLKDKGKDFPPVRAVSIPTLRALGQDPGAAGASDQNGVAFRAPVTALTAYRLNGDPASKYYNLYLSQPFAVIQEKATAQQIRTLSEGRPILWSAHALRASLDSSMAGNTAINIFVDTVDSLRKQISPIASVEAECLNGSYIPGDNPPPPGSEVSFPGTFGLVNALNGEMRTSEVDVELPSPHMPIIFKRTIAGQDLHHGPFGPGWDFNYNQHLVEFKPALFPSGSKAPVVVRNTPDRSTIAEAGDVKLSDGEGHVILFKNRGLNAPVGLEGDPLAKDLGWFEAGGQFYVPDRNTKGVFDILYRFPSGEFCRLNPGGMQFWYAKDGRLLRIKDKYDNNIHVLDYNARGELIRINDLSVSTDPPRALHIGYYRLEGDTQSEMDQVTASAFVAGQICAIRDFADRTNVYKYFDTGVLQRVLHPQTDSTAQASTGEVGFKGNPMSVYLMESASQAGFKGVVEGNGANSGGQNGGSPLFSATLISTGGKPVVKTGTGAGGKVDVSVSASNSAEDGATAPDANQGVRADKAQTSFSFNEHGLPSTLKQTGHDAPEANTGITYTPDGLVQTITGPEGDMITYGYFNNSLIRAKPNVHTITRTPGNRGGPVITSSFDSYEMHYNLPQNSAKNANGKTITYTLTPDNRDIQKIDYGGGAILQWTYNEHGQPLTQSDPNGVTRGWGYRPQDGYLQSESIGSVTTGFDYDGSTAAQFGVPTTIRLPRGTPVAMSYDARLLPKTQTRGLQHAVYAYDENGNEVYAASSVDSGVNREVVRTYNQMNFLTSSKLLAVESGPTGGGQDLETTYVPDEVFRVKEVHLPAGEVQEMKYDHLGRRIKVTTNGRVTDYSYDLNGNLRTTKLSTDSTFGLGPIIQDITYDGHDRPVEVKRPSLNGAETTTIRYFGGGELKTRTVTASTGGDVEDLEIKDVDGYGRPTQIIRHGGNATGTINYKYTASGAGLTTIQTGPKDITTIVTDTAGRLKQHKDSLADRTFTVNDSFQNEQIASREDQTTYTTKAQYDELDRLIGLSDGFGPVATPAPRLDGLPTSTTDPLGHTTQFRYSKMGELLRSDRLESLRMDHNFDKNRRPASVLDRDTKGHQYTYDDGKLRLTKLTLRNRSEIAFNDPNVFNLPHTVTFPGTGGATIDYDPQRRVVKNETTFNGTTYVAENTKYDAAGRERSVDYTTHSSSSTATLTYDKLGPLTKASYSEKGGPYDISYGIREDGARTSITYPSQLTVDEGREDSGRLQKISIAGEASAIWDARFAGATEPVTITRGPLTETRSYDLRKRLIATKVVRTADGALLSEWRFVWDAANNLIARQAIHEQGRADLFTYDDANRLKRVHFGARPSIAGESATPISGLAAEQGLRSGYAARSFTYDASGRDLLMGSSVLDSAEPKPLPFAPFAREIKDQDDFLYARTVDAFGRAAPDALGNAADTRHPMLDGSGAFVEQTATLTHNGRNELVKAARNGTEFLFHYRPDHMLHRKETRVSGSTVADRALVWDGARLIEEYDIANNPKRLLARYYYADGDTPVAADFPDANGSPVRHYFIHDNVMSVTAVVDSSGKVVERMHYDPWGFSLVEKLDSRPPQVAQVLEEAGGSLLFVFSEPVLPKANASALPPIVTGGGSVLATSTRDLSQLFSVRRAGTVVQGEASYVERAGGAPFGTIVRFTPSSPQSGAISIDVAANALFDSWGNGNIGQTIPIGLAGSAGNRFFTTSSNTGPALVASSAVGNPFRFQGQYAELDLGLIYMRARYYDPLTGTFLEPDPMQYEDSVNLYAALGQAPTCIRDPLGTVEIAAKGGAILFEEVLRKGGKEATAEVSEHALDRIARQAVEKAGGRGVSQQEMLDNVAREAVAEVDRQLDMEAFGHQRVRELTAFKSVARRQGRLEIIERDLGEITVKNGRFVEGTLAGHKYIEGADKSYLIINSRARALAEKSPQNSILRMQMEVGQLHELAHAENALLSRLEAPAGPGKFLEEMGVHREQIAIEYAVFGRNNPIYKSPYRISFEKGGDHYLANSLLLSSGYRRLFCVSSRADAEMLFKRFGLNLLLPTDFAYHVR